MLNQVWNTVLDVYGVGLRHCHLQQNSLTPSLPSAVEHKEALGPREPLKTTPIRCPTLGIHYRGVQSEGGAADGGSII